MKTHVESIKVKNVNTKAKFGKASILTTDGVWYSLPENSEANPSDFKKDGFYMVNVSESATGNKYIQSLAETKAPVQATSVDEVFAKSVPAKVNKKEDVDWDEVARGKTRSLLYANVLPAVINTAIDKEKIKVVTEELVEWAMSKIFEGGK